MSRFTLEELEERVDEDDGNWRQGVERKRKRSLLLTE